MLFSARSTQSSKQRAPVRDHHLLLTISAQRILQQCLRVNHHHTIMLLSCSCARSCLSFTKRHSFTRLYRLYSSLLSAVLPSHRHFLASALARARASSWLEPSSIWADRPADEQQQQEGTNEKPSRKQKQEQQPEPLPQPQPQPQTQQQQQHEQQHEQKSRHQQSRFRQGHYHFSHAPPPVICGPMHPSEQREVSKRAIKAAMAARCVVSHGLSAVCLR